MRIDAIVLARGGSKGIPNKNLEIVNGKPLIFWTIEKLKCCKRINEIWVSSDSDEILDYSARHDTQTIKRPGQLANDRASSESAWLHAVDYIEQSFQIETNLIVAPQVTSPIRSNDDFTNAINHFLNEKADSLLSVMKLNDYFIWENKNSQFQPINYNFKNRAPRQNIPHTYLENGSIYIFKTTILREHNNRLGGKISFYCMDKYKQFQIDETEDIKLCEAIMEKYQ